jgi:hypothetical protein
MTSGINFTIGDFDSQKKFREDHGDFIQGFPTLTNTIEVAFNRAPENINLADALIYDLSKEAVNRFSEIGLLCANGVGNGASIILRSMFEYLVTARYLHIHPEKAEDFVNYLFVQMRTVREQTQKIYGKDFATAEYREFIEENFERVRERFTYLMRNGRLKTKSRWVDIGIVDMAIEAGLSQFIIAAYYFPIEKTHPSALFILNRQDQKEDTVSQTLMISHSMIIDVIILQQEHFGIDELKPLIGQCFLDFSKVWKSDKK